MSVNWFDILKISVSSSALTSILGWTLNHFFVRRANIRKDARYLSQRLAIIFEKFSVDCANVITDHELVSSSDGTAGKWHSTLPTLGSFPTESDWKAIDPDLMDRAMSMPNEIELANQAISFWWDVVGDEDCMETETDDQAGLYGLKAWLLASELRTRHRIPASTLHTAKWDFVATLKKQYDATEVRRRKNSVDKGMTFP